MIRRLGTVTLMSIAWGVAGVGLFYLGAYTEGAVSTVATIMGIVCWTNPFVRVVMD